jgi:hypothetical protein
MARWAFFQILPTLRPYARFPFFNMMNTEDSAAMEQIYPKGKEGEFCYPEFLYRF